MTCSIHDPCQSKTEIWIWTEDQILFCFVDPVLIASLDFYSLLTEIDWFFVAELSHAFGMLCVLSFLFSVAVKHEYLSQCQIKTLWPFLSVLSHQQGISLFKFTAHCIFKCCFATKKDCCGLRHMHARRLAVSEIFYPTRLAWLCALHFCHMIVLIIVWISR